jgi:hypothetical protein
MKQTSVQTPLIRRVDYDPEGGTLQVTFHGGIAEYRHVPERVVRAWSASRNPDDFYNHEICYAYDRTV